MNILVACEESQRVCESFRLLGHNAFSCDIMRCSGGHPEWHIKGDVIPLLNGNCAFVTENNDSAIHMIDKWDMIIAFPPCTYFTTAGACRMYHKNKETGESIIDNERYNKMLEMRELFMSIYNANCDKICIENPTPMKIAELPPYTQVIQPYMFGEPWTKRTLLWLKGLPELQPTKIIEPVNGSWVNGDSSKYHKGIKPLGKSSACDRSKTFNGVACAMAVQWGI